jgi:hypothetical protein
MSLKRQEKLVPSLWELQFIVCAAIQQHAAN